MTKVASTATIAFHRKARSPSNSRSSTGRTARRSRSTSQPSSTAEPASGPTTSGSPQPRAGPSMTPRTSPPRPRTLSTVLTGSTHGTEGSRVSGISSSTATMPRTTSGMFSTKMEPHQKWSSSHPPSSGPAGMPTAMAAVTAPMAFVRSSSSKSVGMTERASGTISAPPRPITARATITASGLETNGPMTPGPQATQAGKAAEAPAKVRPAQEEVRAGPGIAA